jgi:hypothetical protein
MSPANLSHLYGTTAAERALTFACDRYDPDPHDVYFRAVGIDAPAASVFRWLCQMRVAPYSYDWLDNGGRRSPRRLIAGKEELRVGQRFMTIFRLAEFERDVHITLVQRQLQRVLGSVAVTYLLVPCGEGACRLVVKVNVRHAGGPIESRLRDALLPWGDLVMMRKQLLTFKQLAEATALSGDGGL